MSKFMYCLLFSLIVNGIVFIEIYLTFYAENVSYFKTPADSAAQVNALQSGNGRIVTSIFSAMPSPQCFGRDTRSDIVWLGPVDWCRKEAPGLFQSSPPPWFASSWTYEPQSGHLFYNEAKKGLMCLSSKDGEGHPLRVVKCAAKDASQKFAVFTFNYKQSTSFAIGRRSLFTFNCIKTSPSSKTPNFASLYWDECLQPKTKYSKFEPKDMGKMNQTLFSLA